MSKIIPPPIHKTYSLMNFTKGDFKRDEAGEILKVSAPHLNGAASLMLTDEDINDHVTTYCWEDERKHYSYKYAGII